MQYKKPTKEKVAKMLEMLKPLGFVGTGENSMTFRHPVIGRDFNFSAISLEAAQKHAVSEVFNMGLRLGYEGSQHAIRKAIGLE